MSSDTKIKLGKRLQHIEAMVSEHYDHIWDCCCDHGLLGAALLSRQAASHIHFVDAAPSLMHALEIKLSRFYPTNTESNSHWHTHCLDAATLPLQDFNGRHLVIIAGVGGDLMTELVTAIHQKNPICNIDFLLCPVHHQFTLRQQLIQLGFSLKNEILITENQRFYEALLVSTANNPHTKIHSVGNLIWQSNTPQQSKIAGDYLQKTLAHYNRIQLNPEAAVQHIIDAYSAITIPPHSY
ncbi:tRNA (adenine(22)-N(1))-methyltransferase [Cellvibrio sp. OA-2007]|uniref:tRNA (adenine(22)-N(1))-methyltransferase n=1 Tax=Cellvibrio sp. OA-2007 TaxID=529823 RepID=UPI000AE055B3|nr:tRNA (adenine(22)-N(1))-methyltransferase TrmK [Cellvibrio sp. OA-2007]